MFKKKKNTPKDKDDKAAQKSEKEAAKKALAERKASEAREAALKAQEAARKASEAQEAARKAKEAEESARKASEAQEASRKVQEAAKKASEAQEAARKAKDAEEAAKKARKTETEAVPPMNAHLLVVIFGDPRNHEGKFIVNRKTRRMFPYLGKHALEASSRGRIETAAVPPDSPYVWAYNCKFVIHDREPGPGEL